jgi:hypothetical protein
VYGKFEILVWKITMMKGKSKFNENVITYALYKNYISKESKVFFKVSHNFKQERNWSYWCAPEVDVIEVKKDDLIIAYEIKGIRKGRGNAPEWPAFYDGIGQALAYLNLPYIGEESSTSFDRFGGGAFDFVYLVYPRDKIENFPAYEKRIFNLLPIGVILVTPEGRFEKVKEAFQNPLQSREAKKHFLENLDTLEKFSVNSRVFKNIREEGEKYFSNL